MSYCRTDVTIAIKDDGPGDLGRIEFARGSIPESAPPVLLRLRRGERWPHVPGERIGRPRAKLAAVDVITIRESAESDGRLADHYGVSIVTIQNARSGRTWRGLSERAT